MKFKTLLMASAAVLVAAPAFAADDITAAFYTPAQGKFLSSTTLESRRIKLDDGGAVFGEEIAKALAASEELTYGVTDNLAVFGTVANAFNVEKDYNNNRNFAYELGAKYTMTYGKVLGQVALAYQTYDPRSWYGKEGEGIEYSTNKWNKALEGTVKLGYVLDCGLTPYTTFSVNDDVTHSAKDKTYSWFLGAHKMLDKVSLDGGFRYDFDSDDFEAWYVQAEANYFVKDNVTVGVFGDYYLGGSPMLKAGVARVTRKDVEYDYTVGLNAKVAF